MKRAKQDSIASPTTRCERWAGRLEWLQGIDAVEPVLALVMKVLRLLCRLARELLA